jgi:hypothetical protein
MEARDQARRVVTQRDPLSGYDAGDGRQGRFPSLLFGLRRADHLWWRSRSLHLLAGSNQRRDLQRFHACKCGDNQN